MLGDINSMELALNIACQLVLLATWCHGLPFTDLRRESKDIQSWQLSAPDVKQWYHDDSNDAVGAEELDIILSPDQKMRLGDKDHKHAAKRRHKRKIVKEDKRWTMPILFKFDSSTTVLQRSHIRRAMNHWQSKTCVLFYEVNSETELHVHHLLFTNIGHRCGSYVGMVPQKDIRPQFINLPYNCLEKFGTLLHELGHALGLWHEHQRPDRDGHVTVMNANLASWAHGNFDRAPDQLVEDQGLPYDFNSVMHYAATAGSLNGSPTLQTRNYLYQKNIGQRVELSFLDSKVINTAYCQSLCALPLPYPCQHGGYQDPNNCGHCRCPDGLAGRFCDQVAPSSNDMCGGTITLGSDTTVTVNSPGYPERVPYDNKVTCNWLIKAPENHTIEMMFLGDFSVYCHNEVCFHWVEVKYKRDFQEPGPRFCCSSRPRQVLESEKPELLLIFRANWTADKNVRRGFSAALHAKPDSQKRRYTDFSAIQRPHNSSISNTSHGVEDESRGEALLVYETITSHPHEETTTQTQTVVPATKPTILSTKSTSPTTQPSTTNKVSTTPVSSTTTESIYSFTWTAWSNCSLTNPCECGSCSHQTRHRLCGGATCPRELASTQSRRCSRLCTKTDVVISFSPSVSINHCPLCCIGFKASGGRCVRE